MACPVSLQGLVGLARVHLTRGDLTQAQAQVIAHRSLQAQAAKISDEELRRSFLDNVAVHREILAAYSESG